MPTLPQPPVKADFFGPYETAVDEGAAAYARARLDNPDADWRDYMAAARAAHDVADRAYRAAIHAYRAEYRRITGQRAPYVL